MNAQNHNQHAWDMLARSGHRFSQSARPDQLADPLQTVDPAGWLGGDIRGWRVLCLAAGGGRQGPLYAAAGATVTVVDISGEQLAIDRDVAHRHGLQLRTVQTSMDQLTMFGQNAFDLVLHPVSTCYVARLQPVYEGVARVIRAGGLYISQHKSPQNMQAALAVNRQGHYVIERSSSQSGPTPSDAGVSRLREPGALEYVHSLQALLGGICLAGFVVEGLVEPEHGQPHAPVGSFGHRCHLIPPYLRVKARRVSTG